MAKSSSRVRFEFCTLCFSVLSHSFVFFLYGPLALAEGGPPASAPLQGGQAVAPQVVTGAPVDFDFLQAIDYPELQVVPRASDRLVMEAQYERESGWGNYFPFQFSAGVTLLSGVMLEGRYKDDFNDLDKADMDLATKSSVGIGLVWLGLTYYLYQQQPYGSDLGKIKAIKSKDKDKDKDKRADLMRERLAEETMERASRTMKIATWASVLTNLAVNGVVFARTNRNNSLVPAAGMVAAFLPLIFQSRYIENYEKHLDYKRKIFAPVASLIPFQPRIDGSGGFLFEPQMVLTWRY
ncbi:MAG: hypothetical protein JNM39_14605 [Bdellovibrionaceae bacterium]|nr:hypothetical protein [Pseudobdellovibrionaceae bacterium]